MLNTSLYTFRMVAYRRNRVQGGYYFFTVNLKNRNQSWLVEHVDLLRSAFQETQQKYPFKTIAVVILPDHMHALWGLPEGDDDYSMRWKYLKGRFTSKLKKRITLRKSAKGKYGVWQDRFWEHTIKDENDMHRHIDYIHYNPVKHHHCDAVKDWKYSSFHRFVENGVLPIDWGVSYQEFKKSFGE